MPRNHTLLPWRSLHRVSTADMAPDAMESAIPPMPPRLPPDVDPGEPDQTRAGEGGGCFVWPLISVLAVLLCALLGHWAAQP